MRSPKGVLIVAIGLCATWACSAKVSSDIQVDGKKLELEGCRSGIAVGFSGIELVGKNGERLRLIQDPTTGVTQVALFPTEGGKGDNLGECGTLTTKPQNSSVNGVRNQEGSATLDCKGGPHEVVGKVKFENCH